MNREDIIRIALDAGIYHEYDSEGHWDGLTNQTLIGNDWLISKDHKLNRIVEILTPFAALVASAERNRTWTQSHWTEYEHAIVAKEREACAELCEMLDVENPKSKSWDEGTIDCANAIRARGDKHD